MNTDTYNNTHRSGLHASKLAWGAEKEEHCQTQMSTNITRLGVHYGAPILDCF